MEIKIKPPCRDRSDTGETTYNSLETATQIIGERPPKLKAAVIKFPSQGFPRNCTRCHRGYRLPWMAATIRDGREKVCPPCFVDELKRGKQ